MKCDQCDSVYINSLFCHERGCPNTFKDFDLDTGLWLDPEPEEWDEDEAAEYDDYFGRYDESE